MSNIAPRHNCRTHFIPELPKKGNGACEVLSSINFAFDPLSCLHRSSNLSVRATGRCRWRRAKGNSAGDKEREGFADAINRAAFGNERVLLQRCGRADATVVPIDDLRLPEALEDRIDLLETRAALAQANKNGVRTVFPRS